jgi:hypothetical protein
MHDSFSAAPFKEIPAALLEVVDKVLDQTGITVTAQPYSDEFMREHPAMSKAKATLDIDVENSTITILCDLSNVQSAIIGHELIHLRRNIVESAPKLFPLQFCEQSLKNDIFMWENELEHLIVIPEEISIFPESEQWWADHYAGILDRFRGHRRTLEFAWSCIQTALPRQTELSDRCWGLARQHGIARQVENHHQRIIRAMPDKQTMIETFVAATENLDAYTNIGQFSSDGGKLTLLPVSV